MNKFLKNNKIISRILCFLMITTPAATARIEASGFKPVEDEGHPDVGTTAAVSKLEQNLNGKRRAFLAHKGHRDRKDILAEILWTFAKLQQSYQDEEYRQSLAYGTGLWFPTDPTLVLICIQRFTQYLSITDKLAAYQLKQLGINSETHQV
ncbi:MAG: hypothetical protein NkDv07_0756 [Candidatus Improbicoccus devescovinae]|nr:MAG: hypothetical protein NkDv07_0756 [Candidatus Improbicoccus devescovinae]